MTILKQTIVAAFLLNTCCLAVVAQKGKPPYQPTAADYARTDKRAFAAFLETHKSPKWCPSFATLTQEANTEKILHMTWFLGDRAVLAMQLLVTPKGHVYTQRIAYEWADQASEQWTLAQSDLKQLQSDLPVSIRIAPRPAFGKVVIVSSRRGTKWQTTLHDRAKLPASLQKLMEGPPGRYIRVQNGRVP